MYSPRYRGHSWFGGNTRSMPLAPRGMMPTGAQSSFNPYCSGRNDDWPAVQGTSVTI